MKMLAAEAILRVIKEHGIDLIFGYPGAANTPLYDRMEAAGVGFILTRNEQGAAHAASSFYKMTGKVGVCTATSGPGATNLVTGIANAYMDSIPLVAVTGQVLSSQVGKDAFQEVDTTGVTTPISKHNYLVKNAQDIPRIMQEAFYIAGTGRPGPVVVDVPMNLQLQEIEYTPGVKPALRGYHPSESADEKQVHRLARAICKAHRPVIAAGGGILSSKASEAFTRLVESTQIPVVSTLMGLDALPSAHPLHLGMFGLHGRQAANAIFSAADLVIFFGARVSDRSVGNPKGLREHAVVAHIDIDPAEISKNIPCDLSVIGHIPAVLKILDKELADYRCPEEWSRLASEKKASLPEPDSRDTGYVNPKYFLRSLSEAAGPDAVVATEVGQNQIWTANYYSFRRPNHFLTSGGFGTMGYGLPAAIGAKAARPDSTVIAVEGDGSFQMSMPELATIRQWGLDVKIVVLVNQSLGMVREYQKTHYKERYVSVDLGTYPHWAHIAKAYDIPYGLVEENSKVPDAVRALLDEKGSYLLEVRVDPFFATLP